MNYQHAQVVHWMNNPKKTIIPGSMEIDLTNICNQDCYYCNTDEYRKQFPIQKHFKEYIKLLDKLADWNKHSPNSIGTLNTISYAGAGEPTLLRNYERVIEHTIDLGFMTSMTTNGTYLNKLLENVNIDKLKKIGWIGIDIDAGTKELYETIRKTISKKSIFDKVCQNAQDLVSAGVTVDIKFLIGEYNDSESAIRDMFALVKKLGARQAFFRPVVINNVIYPIQNLTELLEKLSIEYDVRIRYNVSKFLKRNYNRCHQMFQYPIFRTDGKIYVCCEETGNPKFEIGSWDTGDFRDVWLGQRHWDVYNSTNTHLCQPCSPNHHNIKIQNIIDNPELMEQLYF
jgi:sulfatase maturation enzyme AslB (radical SAM superfamily)